jgi:hypothetical protein
MFWKPEMYLLGNSMSIKPSKEKTEKGWVLLAKASRYEEVGAILKSRMGSPEIASVFAGLKARTQKDPTLRFRIVQKASGFRVEEYKD